MRRRITFALAALALSAGLVSAQTRMPIVVPAVGPSAVTTTPAAPAAAASEMAQNGLKLLQEIKAANEEVLKKQEATLQQLDELQKAAEQLKIFSTRG